MWHWECKKHGDGERYLLGVVGVEECPLCRLEKLEPVLEAVKELVAYMETFVGPDGRVWVNTPVYLNAVDHVLNILHEARNAGVV